jgi:hypothetical protein
MTTVTSLCIAGDSQCLDGCFTLDGIMLAVANEKGKRRVMLIVPGE